MEEPLECRASVERVLEQLDREAPGVPLLALGQTVFWDEPTKSILLLLMEACQRPRPFFFGVHDTDYFARLHTREWRAVRSEWRGDGFALLAHNDGSTRGLWSAAGEISCLFGSETMPTRARYREAGAQLEQVAQHSPQGREAFIDSVTEAWGWRGLVATERVLRPVYEIPVREVLPALDAMLRFGFEGTVQCLAEPTQRERARQRAEMIRRRVHELTAFSDTLSLADLYRALYREFLVWLVGHVPAQVGFTRTTELLRFTPQTAHLPRFQLLQLFLHPRTRPVCERAYNEAVADTEIYTLDEFGEGALPFDLLIPGRGRGTLLLTERYLTVLTPEPFTTRLKQPVETVDALAEVIAQAFGEATVLIGKALTLVPMLAHEFVFVFNERGSPYLKQTAHLLQLLQQAIHPLPLAIHPVLRLRYASWDTIGAECVQLRLPDHLAAAFGERELCSEQFAKRWRAVVQAQQQLLRELSACRSPRELMRYLADWVRENCRQGVQWRDKADEYEQLHTRLRQVREQADALRQQAHALHAERRALKAERARLEREKGEHLRQARRAEAGAHADAQAGARTGAPLHYAQREACEAQLQAISERLRTIRQQLRQLLVQRLQIGRTPELVAVRERVRQLEYEAEAARIELARNAILTADGLLQTNARPSAWWFLLVSDAWFRANARQTEIYLESLSAGHNR